MRLRLKKLATQSLRHKVTVQYSYNSKTEGKDEKDKFSRRIAAVSAQKPWEAVHLGSSLGQFTWAWKLDSNRKFTYALCPLSPVMQP